jgi:hypothetical protein
VGIPHNMRIFSNEVFLHVSFSLVDIEHTDSCSASVASYELYLRGIAEASEI